MSDFDLLQTLQKELVETLRERQTHCTYITQHASRARIHRLRMALQEVMLRIERQCERTTGCYYPVDLIGETWFQEVENGQRTDL